MELSEEVKKKYSRLSDLITEAFIAGYQQAIDDMKEKERKHRQNLREIAQKTMKDDIERLKPELD